ncbi:MAG: MarR family winged helix-turn-helix transcriptional regulator [Azospirillaceae bacterium]
MSDQSIDRHDPQTALTQERLAHLTRLAARGYSRSLQIRLAEREVSFGQWVFLRILWDEDGLTQRQLSEKAGLTEPTTHTALQKLEARGYVTRRNLPGNRRRQHAFLTEAGRALREVLEPMALEVNDIALAGLEAGEIEVLRRCLLKVIANLEQDETSKGEAGFHMPPTRVLGQVD